MSSMCMSNSVNYSERLLNINPILRIFSVFSLLSEMICKLAQFLPISLKSSVHNYFGETTFVEKSFITKIFDFLKITWTKNWSRLKYQILLWFPSELRVLTWCSYFLDTMLSSSWVHFVFPENITNKSEKRQINVSYMYRSGRALSRRIALMMA